MRRLFILLFVCSIQGFAVEKDPFVKPAKKVLFNQRFQYLGYIKFNQKTWAYLKPVSRDIERIGMGKVVGLGKVKIIKPNKVCIEKNHHIYCLYKSAQAGIWR